MEYIDIRDEAGRRTGLVKEREEVHRDGDLHATSHVWIVNAEKKAGLESREDTGRSGPEGSVMTCQVLLQKRSMNKDAYPGCYDISSAGHLSAGQDYFEAACRELEEEGRMTVRIWEEGMKLPF